ncbi:MAG: ABC transporter ATP-binding protein [Elusimicrobiota bacterium]
MKNLNLKMEKENFTGIIGPNGSGKTTLLKIITGILKNETGQVKVDGRNIKNLKPKQKSRIMAYVPSESLINFNYTVLDIVIFGRYPYTGRLDRYKKTDKKKAFRALEICGVASLTTRLFNTLSSGEKKKVLLARALCQKTDILLLDEPAAHLDIHHVKEIFNLLTELSENGIKIIAVIHDINLASVYCDDVIVLKQGEIKYKGEKKAVVNSDFLSNIYGGEVEVKNIEGNSFIIP